MLKAELILDFGNSENRATLRVGDLEDGSRQEHEFEFPNRFSVVFGDLPKSDEYNETNTIAFEMDNKKLGEDELDKGVYVTGLMSEREFQNVQLKPTAMTPKYNSATTLLSTASAIIRATLWIQEYFKNHQNREIPIAKLINGIEWHLTVLLPPQQVDYGTKVFIEDLQGLMHVTYRLPEVRAGLQLKSVEVYSEGVMAYMAVLIKKSDKSVRADMKMLLKSNVLVIDIGAGTTDIVLINKNAPVEGSKYTINLGGNNIKQKLRSKINREYGLQLPDAYYEEAAINGVIKQGNKEYNVIKELDISKQEVAMQISSEIQGFLESSDISIQTVEKVLVVGGGSMKNIQEITPISEYILKGLKRFNRNVDLVETSGITTDNELSLGSLEQDIISPRKLNLVGAGIVKDLKEIKRIKASKVNS